MKKIIVSTMIFVVALSVFGCSHNVGTSDEKQNGGEAARGAYEIFERIYLCDDVYRTDDTPTYGEGTVYFNVRSDVFDVADFKLLMCVDECERSAVVSRAAQGYAPAYEVVETYELSGREHTIFKYKMQIPEKMAQEYKAQGVYGQIEENINGSYYYLASLSDNVYAYLHLERKEDAVQYETESDIADDYVRNAVFDVNVRKNVIPFEGDELYAAAYLGYDAGGNEVPDHSRYSGYLDEEDLEIHHVSGGEYYLIIPRYDGMKMKLYKNSIDSDTPSLLFETDEAQPFIVCCNISDIFPDVTVEFTHENETVSFSPFISLKDGSFVAGERGLILSAE